jgi:hypothetical protein
LGEAKIAIARGREVGTREVGGGFLVGLAVAVVSTVQYLVGSRSCWSGEQARQGSRERKLRLVDLGCRYSMYYIQYVLLCTV